jgi:hypothetical protein
VSGAASDDPDVLTESGHDFLERYELDGDVANLQLSREAYERALRQAGPEERSCWGEQALSRLGCKCCRNGLDVSLPGQEDAQRVGGLMPVMIGSHGTLALPIVARGSGPAPECSMATTSTSTAAAAVEPVFTVTRSAEAFAMRTGIVEPKPARRCRDVWLLCPVRQHSVMRLRSDGTGSSPAAARGRVWRAA